MYNFVEEGKRARKKQEKKAKEPERSQQEAKEPEKESRQKSQKGETTLVSCLYLYCRRTAALLRNMSAMGAKTHVHTLVTHHEGGDIDIKRRTRQTISNADSTVGAGRKRAPRGKKMPQARNTIINGDSKMHCYQWRFEAKN